MNDELDDCGEKEEGDGDGVRSAFRLFITDN